MRDCGRRRVGRWPKGVARGPRGPTAVERQAAGDAWRHAQTPEERAAAWAGLPGAGPLRLDNVEEPPLHLVALTRRRDAEGAWSSYFTGLLKCGRYWGCPVCALAIASRKAEEVTHAVQSWRDSHGGEGATLLLTLTLRHRCVDTLADTLWAVRKALSRMSKPKNWKKLLERYGIVGWIAAREITHGVNGWHPHLHLVVFLARALSTAEIEELRCAIGERWRRAIVIELSEEHAPDDEHGCDLRALANDEYIAKLGLEVGGGSTTKEARRLTSRTHWQIAEDLVEHRRPRDAELMNEFMAATFRMPVITWKQGFRDLVGLAAEQSDEELVAGDGADKAAEETIYEFEHVWRGRPSGGYGASHDGWALVAEHDCRGAFRTWLRDAAERDAPLAEVRATVERALEDWYAIVLPDAGAG